MPSVSTVFLSSLNGLHVAVAVALVLYNLLRLAHSRVGRIMTAICQDETAAELMGLNVRAYKLFIFAFGGALAALAGGLNAHFTFFISPNEFGFERAVEILAMGVLGGTGSPWGAVIGAMLITLLPELLRGLGPLSVADQRRDPGLNYSFFAEGHLGSAAIYPSGETRSSGEWGELIHAYAVGGVEEFWRSAGIG